jgi:hypothetical protein
MVYPYTINNREELYRLSELASKEDFPIYISTPYGQLDARSVLGLFSIIGKEINLVAPDCADIEKFQGFINKL